MRTVEKNGAMPKMKYWAVKNRIKPVIEHEDRWSIIPKVTNKRKAARQRMKLTIEK